MSRAPIERNEIWLAARARAEQQMGRWNRRASDYLIDTLLDPDNANRRWLEHHFEYLARVTREREHDEEQYDGALRWYVSMIAPGGIRVRVRVLVNPRTNRIFNAFPDRTLS